MTIDSLANWRSVLAAAAVTGSILALFVVLSMMVKFDHWIWLAVNNALVIFSLTLLLLLSLAYGWAGRSIGSLAFQALLYVVLVIVFYVGSYAAATYFIPEKLAWMPFFYRDYTYHGYQSVTDMMNTRDNFRALLILQLFSSVVSSALYAAAAFSGYAIGSLTRPRSAS